MNELDLLRQNAGIDAMKKAGNAKADAEAQERSMKKTIDVKVINSGYGTDMGMKSAEIISQELDGNMKPILKVRIKDVNMGDPVIAEWRNNMWTVDMD